jgi:hypothetical protein
LPIFAACAPIAGHLSRCPAIPLNINRERHRDTFCRETPSTTAIPESVCPLAAINTIFARPARRTETLRPRASLSNSSRSPPDKINFGATRIVFPPQKSDTLPDSYCLIIYDALHELGSQKRYGELGTDPTLKNLNESFQKKFGVTTTQEGINRENRAEKQAIPTIRQIFGNSLSDKAKKAMRKLEGGN